MRSYITPWSKVIIIVVIMTFVFRISPAQTPNISFNSSIQTYTSIDGAPGTILLSNGCDDLTFPASGYFPIGFPFTWGLTYTQFHINENGFINLDSVIYTSYGSMESLSRFTVFGFNKDEIYQIWGEPIYVGNKLGLMGALNQDAKLMYQLSGTAPNRVLTVEWKNWGFVEEVGQYKINFQILLYENGNKVETRYGNYDMNPNFLNTLVYYDIRIGIRGDAVSSNTEFLNKAYRSFYYRVKSTDERIKTNDWSKSIEWSSLYQDFYNGSFMDYGRKYKPIVGLTYQFSYKQCNGFPDAGNTLVPVNPVCQGRYFRLSTDKPDSINYSYEWEVSSDSSQWIFMHTVKKVHDVYVSQYQDISYYRCKVTCKQSGQYSFSKPVKVTLLNSPDPLLCNCNYSNQVPSDNIDIVNFLYGTLNNTSDTSSHVQGYSIKNIYSDFTHLPAPEIRKNVNVPFSISISAFRAGGGKSYVIKIYIDLNKNGSFSDAGENIYTSSSFWLSYTLTPVIKTASLLLPVTALTGITTMRVMVIPATNPNHQYYSPCNIYGNEGEAEDYMVNIQPESICSAIFDPGRTFSSLDSACYQQTFILSYENAVTQSGISRQWQSSTDSINWINIAGQTSFTYSTTQQSTVYYRCRFTCSASGQVAFSSPIKMSMKSFLNCYCLPTILSDQGSQIVNVNVKNINNSSDCYTTLPLPSVKGKYSDYKKIVAPLILTQGETVIAVIRFENCNGLPYSNKELFIDYNRNGIFDSEFESAEQSNAGPVENTKQFLIKVPLSALPGLTGMRVIYRSSNAGCTTFANGEIEDYLVDIQPLAEQCTGGPNPGKTISDKLFVTEFDNKITLRLENPLVAGGFTYQWESSVNNTTWYPKPGALFSELTTAQITPSQNSGSYTGKIYYRCKITCLNSGAITYSTPVEILSYCYRIQGNILIKGWSSINSVSLGALNANSECNTLLSKPLRYDLPIPGIKQNIPVSFYIRGGECGNDLSASLSVFIKIFIDLNRNGRLTDVGEELYVSPVFLLTSGGQFTRNGFITIPSSALPGITLMRVMLIDGYSPEGFGPCTLATGEVEDYFVNIISSIPCTGTPDAGNTLSNKLNVCKDSLFFLSLQNHTQLNTDGINYQWQLSGDNETWENISAATEITLITSQSTTKYYRCRILCAGNPVETFSIPVKVEMKSFIDCYCSSGPSKIWDLVDIFNVSCGSINNSSNCQTYLGGNSVTGSYSNYKLIASPGNIQQGKIINFSLTGATCTYDIGFDEGDTMYVFKVYIDYNQNGSFEDTIEKIFVSGKIFFNSYGGAYTVSGSFQVPFTSLTGNTVMRVILMDRGSATGGSCTKYNKGETEDYMINIEAATPCTGMFDHGETVAFAKNLCLNDSVRLSLQFKPIDGGFIYQWQSSSDSVNWTLIPNETDTVCKALFQNTTFYRCAATCTNTLETSFTKPVKIIPFPPFYVPPFTEGFEEIAATSPYKFPCYWNNDGYPWMVINPKKYKTQDGSDEPWAEFGNAASGNNELHIPLPEGSEFGNPVNLFTKGVQLTTGITYKISFYGMLSNPIPKLNRKAGRLWVGHGQNESQMTDSLLEPPMPLNGVTYNISYRSNVGIGNKIWTHFTPEESGIYYFGFLTYEGQSLDDFTIEPYPECQFNPPQFVDAINRGTNDVFVSWICPGYTGEYIVEYGPFGFIPGTDLTPGPSGKIIIANTNSALITNLPYLNDKGLGSITEYEAYVRVKCINGEYSQNARPVYFNLRYQNDNCEGAVVLDCSKNGNVFNKQYATSDTVPKCTVTGDIEGYPGLLEVKYGLWFKVIGNDKKITLDITQGIKGRLFVFSGSYENLTCYGFNEDGILSFNAYSGTDYYILLGDLPRSSWSGVYKLVASCTPICTPSVSNDKCSGFQMLTVAGNTEQYTLGNNFCSASSPIPEIPIDDNQICGHYELVGGIRYYQLLNEVWYKFNSGNNNNLELYLNNNGVAPPVMIGQYFYAVYSGNCNNPVYSGCGSISVNSSAIINSLNMNTDYYLRIYRTSNWIYYNTSNPQYKTEAGYFRIMLKEMSFKPYCLDASVEPVNGSKDRCIGSQNLKWPPVIGAKSYDVYLSAGTNPPENKIANGITSTSTFISNLLANTTYYWKVVPKNDYGEAISCNVFNFTTGNHGCYPNVRANQNHIWNVNVGSLNNNTGCSDLTYGGVYDFTNLPPPILYKNNATPSSVTIGSCRELYVNLNNDAYVKIFIDLNQDGDFSDADEEVFSKMQPDLYYAKTAVLSDSIVIPSSALTGITTMRVVIAFGFEPTPPFTYIFEAEDYVVNIQPSQTCVPPLHPGIITGNTTVCRDSSIVLKLTGFSNNTIFQWQKATTINGPWTDIPGAVNYRLSTGPENTAMHYRVKVTCSEEVYTEPFLVSIRNFNECYCSFATLPSGNYNPEIYNVKFGEINNSSFYSIFSRGSAYSDFTNLGSYYFDKLVPYNFSALVGGEGEIFGLSASIAVFIDYNQNGSFNDEGEMVFVQGPLSLYLSGSLFSGSITIPSFANTGITRMRVIAIDIWNPSFISSCWSQNYYYGEMEDYLINIRDCFSLLPLTISSSDVATNFCNGTELTVHSAMPINSYSWSTGQNTQSIMLTTANTAGNYSVNVTYVNGCSTSAGYSYNPQSVTSSYTLLAKSSVKLQSNNTVLNGSVGVVNATGSASIKKNVSINGTGAFLKAQNISLQVPYTIPTIVYAQASVALPTMQYNTTSTSGLANATVPNGTTITLAGNLKNITIGSNCNVTLTGNIFGAITIGSGSSILFTQSSIDVTAITMNAGTVSANTQIKFNGDAIVRCTGSILVNTRSIVNPDNHKIIFYLGKTSGAPVTFTIAAGGNETVNASMYIPTGKISVGGHATNMTYMNGKFIAENIETLDKNVIWNWYDCTPVAAAPLITSKTSNANKEQTTKPITGLNVKAWPNPSEHQFTLNVESKSNEPVSISVYDMYGRIVYSTSGTANRQYQFGNRFVSGAYLAEVKQGVNRSIVKLIKQ